jgi:formyl-CoA transferase
VPALESMRVLDFTQWEAGPSCSMMLAWLGADVVKLEPPGGEIARKVLGVGPGDSQYFLNYNANKRGIAINLKTTAGRKLLLDMIPRFDVFVENQGPGVVESLKLDPEILCALNPKLIYARIKGYGLSGPYSDYKSFDPLALAASGIFSMTGAPEGPPMPPGASFADTGTGLHAALGITAAYVQQQRTGKGQVIELSMHEAMTMFIRTMTAMYWGPDSPPAPRRSHDGFPPSGIYRCKGGGPNDYAVMLIVLPRMWQALCEAIGHPELTDDARFAQPAGRFNHQTELHAIIEGWTLQRDKQEVMRVLGEAGVPVSATYDTAQVFNDPHLIARDFFKKVPHPEKGEILMMRSPIRLSDSEVPITAAPLAGQHTAEVLRAELGLKNDEIATLMKDGVIAGGK